MKRILALFAALVICAVCALPAAGQVHPAASVQENREFSQLTADAGLQAAAGSSVQEDGITINLPLVTTLIIVICSVLTIAIIAAVIYLGRKNRS